MLHNKMVKWTITWRTCRIIHGPNSNIYKNSSIYIYLAKNSLQLQSEATEQCENNDKIRDSHAESLGKAAEKKSERSDGEKLV